MAFISYFYHIKSYKMQFDLNEEQLMIQKAARDFAKSECLPGVIDRDEKQQFPRGLRNWQN